MLALDDEEEIDIEFRKSGTYVTILAPLTALSMDESMSMKS
jgi:hypothetical protein